MVNVALYLFPLRQGDCYEKLKKKKDKSIHIYVYCAHLYILRQFFIAKARYIGNSTHPAVSSLRYFALSFRGPVEYFFFQLRVFVRTKRQGFALAIVVAFALSQ